jgi:hypothetical protein
MAYLLVLLSGQDPTSVGIITNGGDTIEQCQALGRERIAKMGPVKSWIFFPTGERHEKLEPAELHWRIECVRL